MFNIDNFLIKFKNLKPKDSDVKKTIINSVSKILKIEIKESEISVKNEVIYIKTNSIIKNEIFINKSKILKEVETLLNKKNIENII